MAKSKKKSPAKRRKKSPELNLSPEKVLERFSAGPFDGVFTDGACTGNPGPGGWGVVWVRDNQVVDRRNGRTAHTTNNRMELSALIAAYKMLPADAELTIYSDSNLCVQTLNLWAASWKRRGWKRKTGPVENLELVKEAYALHLAHRRVKLEWIKAHNGSRWNEYADALATAYLREDAPEPRKPAKAPQPRKPEPRKPVEAPQPPKPAEPPVASPPRPAGTLDVEALRAETPGCAERCHLDNAGASLMPGPVIEAIREHLELEGRIGGYEAAAERREAIASAYQAVADLLGCEPRNVAMVENATTAFAQALSAIPFERGDLILTTRNDYASSQIMYLSLVRRFGIELVRAPDQPEGGVDPDAMLRLIRDRRPRLVAITQMPCHSGLLQPVAAIGRQCRELGIPLLVDGSQTIGQLPIDVDQLHCDFFCATSRKFLRGPRGAGFLYVSDPLLERGLEPLFPDLRGATWEAPDKVRPQATARRFENWEFSYALVLGTGAAARYANRLDGKAVAKRACALAAEARRRLAEIDGVRVLDRGSWLGAIASFAVAGWKSKALEAELRRRRITTSISHRAYAVIDFDHKKVDWALRISPHYFNTEDEIRELAAAIAELMDQSPTDSG
ncbi:MAG: aminotransferase class V-fold PLP-dependent enzyme [bacterium]|nr:aminotransferase class V-fold PLP-dependent enzyme [bacterium]